MHPGKGSLLATYSPASYLQGGEQDRLTYRIDLELVTHDASHGRPILRQGMRQPDIRENLGYRGVQQ